MSAKIGTQLCSSVPISVPPDVHGVVMISEPGSGFTAPTQVCIAAVPELTVTAYLTPFFSANRRSNSSILGPLLMLAGLDHLGYGRHVVVAEVVARAEGLRPDRVCRRESPTGLSCRAPVSRRILVPGVSRTSRVRGYSSRPSSRIVFNPSTFFLASSEMSAVVILPIWSRASISGMSEP